MASRVPTVGNVKASCASLPLRLQLSARLLTAAFSGGATGLHATRKVVAGKHDLEVVGYEGARVAVARHIELSDCKGTKKARETSEIVGSGGQHQTNRMKLTGREIRVIER